MSGVSDRHSRSVSGLSEAGERPLVVRVVAARAAVVIADQHLLACLVNMLVRMEGVVAELQLDLPDAPLRVPLPHATSRSSLPDALVALSAWATGALVSARRVATNSTPAADYVISVGPFQPGGSCGRPNLVVHGDGWRAWAGSDVEAAPTTPPASDQPLGPYLAACVAAGEVFKRFRGLRRGVYADAFGVSLWSGRTGSWDELEEGPEPEGLRLPPIHLVGAGAVGQGLMLALGALRPPKAYVVTIDDDTHDTTNLNRCFVAGVLDVGSLKVEAVARFRRSVGLDGFECPRTLAAYAGASGPHGLREDVALKARDRYPVIVSAVDKGASRQDVRGLAPDLVVGGSTLGLTAKVGVFDGAPGAPCLGCNNPAEQDGARLREIEKELRGLDEDARRRRLSVLGDDTDSALDYLRDAPRCGTVGEAAFLAFATQAAAEFSVPFVSMGAAVQVAARLIARVAFPQTEPSRPSTSSITFLNCDADNFQLASDPTCRWCQ